jgi:hypothetical protein
LGLDKKTKKKKNRKGKNRGTCLEQLFQPLVVSVNCSKPKDHLRRERGGIPTDVRGKVTWRIQHVEHHSLAL